MIHNVCVVGAGGIGSYFIEEIATLVTKKQIDISKLYVYDFDKVDYKNIWYQNFNIDEIGYYKADCISRRFFFEPVIKKFNKEQFDSIVNPIICNHGPTDFKFTFVLCVDNWQTRKEFFELYFALSEATRQKINWIDMRSHGRQIGCYISCPKNDLERMLTTLPSKENEDKVAPGSNSCQNPFDIQKSLIQLGNKIIATVGAQMFLNLYRDNVTSTSFQYVI